MGFSRGPKIVTDGLVLCLDGINSKSYPGSGDIWYDLIDPSTTMNLINSPTQTPNGFSFNGIDQYAKGINMPNFQLSESYSIEVVFRLLTLPTETYNDNMHILLGQVGNNHTIFVYPQQNGSSSIGMCYDDSRYQTKHKSFKRISKDEWVSFHVNGYPSTLGDLEYYMNGKLDTPRFTSGDSNGSGFSSTWRLGFDGRWNKYSHLEVGVIRLYNRTLTDQEIKQNYNATKSRFGL
jgi:hypothetical protein